MSEIKPIWIRQTDAPKMLGVSKYFFNLHLKPQLNPIILSSRCVVYDYVDLQKFCGSVKERADNWGKLKGGKECPTNQLPTPSNLNLEERSGMSLESTDLNVSDLVAEQVTKIRQS